MSFCRYSKSSAREDGDISVLYDVPAYFVSSLVRLRELQKLRKVVADAVEGKDGRLQILKQKEEMR